MVRSTCDKIFIDFSIDYYNYLFINDFLSFESDLEKFTKDLGFRKGTLEWGGEKYIFIIINILTFP